MKGLSVSAIPQTELGSVLKGSVSKSIGLFSDGKTGPLGEFMNSFVPVTVASAVTTLGNAATGYKNDTAFQGPTN